MPKIVSIVLKIALLHVVVVMVFVLVIMKQKDVVMIAFNVL